MSIIAYRSPPFAGLLFTLCIGLLSGCSLGIDFNPNLTNFKCPENGECQPGYTCNSGQVCEPIVLSQDVPLLKDDSNDIHVSGDATPEDTTADAPSLPDVGDLKDISPVEDGTPQEEEVTSLLDALPNNCGGITKKGCCSVDNGVTTAFTCTDEGEKHAVSCTQDGQICGWMEAGYYACTSDGLAGPIAEFPYICPGEECAGSCADNECATDGCGNFCDCEDSNAGCQDGSCVCNEGFNENAQGECVAGPPPCPPICSNGCQDQICEINCDEHKDNEDDYCNEMIQCPEGRTCRILCNEENVCSKGIVAPASVPSLIITCTKNKTCRGPIDSAATITTVSCAKKESCRRCPEGTPECTGSFELACAGDQCTLECPEGNGNQANGSCNGPITCSAKICEIDCLGKWSCANSIECDQDELPEEVNSTCTVNCGEFNAQQPTNACAGSILINGSDIVDVNCGSPYNCRDIVIVEAGAVDVACSHNNTCLDSLTPAPDVDPGGIHCQAESCEIHCLGTASCANVFVDNTTFASVECAGNNSCGGQTSCSNISDECVIDCDGTNSCTNLEVDGAYSATIECGPDACKGAVVCSNTTETCSFSCNGNNSCGGAMECNNSAICHLNCANQNSCNSGSYLCNNSGSCHLYPDQTDLQPFTVAQNKAFLYKGIPLPLDSYLNPRPCITENCNGGATGWCINPISVFTCCNWAAHPDNP